jgi:hypothetical protein
MRQRVFTSVRSVVLVALLLVPLVSSGHHHAPDARSAGSCALCVVTHHAPAIVTALPSAPAPSALQLAAVSEPIAAPPHRVPSSVAGRAPPITFPITIS